MPAKSCFRPRVESLEGREVPAAGSFVLSDGTIGSLQFETPDGVDPEEASQSIPITDLTIIRGTQDFLVQGTATADYQYGVLIGVTATAIGTVTDNTILTLADGSVSVDYGESAAGGSVAYDPADTQMTFTFEAGIDGVVGAISYDIPWDQVDPTQASQSLSLANFKLNIAGQNLAPGSASFTTAPTALFANGDFVGLSFAINTAGIGGFPYTSLSMSGLNVTATGIGGGTINAVAAKRYPAIVVDFSTWFTGGNDMSLSIYWKLSDGTDDGTTIPIPSGTSKEVVRDLVFSVLEDNGLKPTPTGETRLVVKGTPMAQLTEFRLSVTGQSNTWTGPTYKGRVATTDISPAFYLNGDKKSP